MVPSSKPSRGNRPGRGRPGRRWSPPPGRGHRDRRTGVPREGPTARPESVRARDEPARPAPRVKRRAPGWRRVPPGATCPGIPPAWRRSRRGRAANYGPARAVASRCVGPGPRRLRSRGGRRPRVRRLPALPFTSAEGGTNTVTNVVAPARGAAGIGSGRLPIVGSSTASVLHPSSTRDVLVSSSGMNQMPGRALQRGGRAPIHRGPEDLASGREVDGQEGPRARLDLEPGHAEDGAIVREGQRHVRRVCPEDALLAGGRPFARE